ncbi:uncharacterized protein LOC143819824 [Paroedura picta]|uniref:uncharacterized protein LOC143819824 n=1 Tax=Paroedura picta TaxID=143630 RepID=UPI0040565FF6
MRNQKSATGVSRPPSSPVIDQRHCSGGVCDHTVEKGTVRNTYENWPISSKRVSLFVDDGSKEMLSSCGYEIHIYIKIKAEQCHLWLVHGSETTNEIQICYTEFPNEKKKSIAASKSVLMAVEEGLMGFFWLIRLNTVTCHYFRSIYFL